MHLLLVDDDEDLRAALAELLEDEGFRVTQAANGLEALAACDVDPPDLIVLDYMMPVMSGGDFLRARRARPDVNQIPVVLLTAARRCPVLDALAPDAVVAKPFEIPTLLRTIAEVSSATPGK